MGEGGVPRSSIEKQFSTASRRGLSNLLAATLGMDVREVKKERVKHTRPIATRMGEGAFTDLKAQLKEYSVVASSLGGEEQTRPPLRPPTIQLPWALTLTLTLTNLNPN